MMLRRSIIDLTKFSQQSKTQVRSCSVQKLFIDKIREYGQKKKNAGGKLVEATPETEKEMQTEMDRLAKQFGGGSGVDLMQFPQFDFEDPKLDSVEAPSAQAVAVAAEENKEKKDEEKKKK